MNSRTILGLALLACLPLACDRAGSDECARGYQDYDADGQCMPTCATAALNCGQFGSCDDRAGLAVCDCMPGWAGEACHVCADGFHEVNSSCVADTPCQADQCSGHGGCDDTSGMPVCSCDTGYGSDDCSLCANGYQDNDTDGSCLPTCGTAGFECTGPGQCNDDYGRAVCDCDLNFQDHDDDHTCEVDCIGANLDCKGVGACDDASGSAVCVCDAGYAGAACEDCAPGYHREGDLCVIDLACPAADECEPHGSCDDSAGFPRCVCDQAWTGARCDACAAGYFDEQGSCVANLPQQVDAGSEHACALMRDGQVRCWGSNWNGQLGAGDVGQWLNHPIVVLDLVGVVQLSGGYRHTCAVLGDGSASCWGLDYDGQLGNGAGGNSDVPLAVSNLTDVDFISAGEKHTCARQSTGALWCWGSNLFGQLGDGNAGSDIPAQAPQAVPGLNGMAVVDAGESHTCAIDGGGAGLCWGDNTRGQIGDGSYADRPAPQAIAGLGDAELSSLDAGRFQSCATLIGGAIACWGSNAHGALGDGLDTHEVCATSEDCSPLPVWVDGLNTAHAVSVGEHHACAVSNDGRAWCWGRNHRGQLGDGTFNDSNLPREVSGLTDVSWVTAGENFSCALTGSGQVWCWGSNMRGQCGDGLATHQSCSGEDCSPVPVQVIDLP